MKFNISLSSTPAVINPSYLRAFNYSLNTIYNTVLFFFIFLYGDREIKIIFNKIDILIAIVPLMLTLGIDKIFPFYKNDKVKIFEIYSNLFSLLILTSIILLVLLITFNAYLSIAVFFGFIYAYNNIASAFMCINDSYNYRFAKENIFKSILVFVFVLIHYYWSLKLNINSLFFFAIANIIMIVSSNYRTVSFTYNFRYLINTYFYNSKFIIILIILGTIYGNVPRIFEIINGSDDLSVKYFFWFRILSYLGALGALYNYLITKHIIHHNGFNKIDKYSYYTVLFYGIFITIVNLLNYTNLLGLFNENKVLPLVLFLFSMTNYLAYIKDIYIEIALSLSNDFKSKFVIFSKVFLLTFIVIGLFVLLNIINSINLLIILFISTIYWFILGYKLIKKSAENRELLNKNIIIYSITLILNLFFLI